MLGIPIGPKDYIKAQLCKKVVEASQPMAKIKNLKSNQIKMLLLRYCTQTKVTHLFRATDPTVSKEAAEIADKVILAHVYSLLDLSAENVDERTVNKIRLSLSFGGLGFQAKSDIRHACYLSSTRDIIASLKSWIQQQEDEESFQATQLNRILDKILHEDEESISACLSLSAEQQRTATEENTMARFYQAPKDINELKNWNFKVQPALSQLVAQLQFNQLVSSAIPVEKVQLISQQGKGASQFLSVLPRDPFTQMNNDEFHISVREYLGLPLINRYLPGKEICRCFHHRRLSD